MESKTFTTETRLERSHPLIHYYNQYIPWYSKVYRQVFHMMTAPDFKTKWPNKSEFVSFICKKYGILKRTANSIVNDIEGTIKAYLALKETELNAAKQKIKKIEKKVYGLKNTINTMKPKVAENRATEAELKKYRNAKKSLYAQQNNLQKYRDKIAKLERIIKNKIVKIGFGSKKMFKKQYHLAENGYKSHAAWYDDYVKARDKNVYYLGSSDERCGNQLFQMTYNSAADDFTVKIRKEDKFVRGKNPNKYIIIKYLKFKHLHDELVEVVKAYEKDSKLPKKPLSYRIRKLGNKWYLQVTFRIDVEQWETSNRDGVIGLDYNEGFIELSETDEHGNLIHQAHYDFKYHGTGNKAKSELEETVAEIVTYAKNQGKDIVIEDLNFKKSKAKTVPARTKNGKKYNRMMHAFDYSRYKSTFENTTHRNKVCLHKVNPANTSKIGKEKYCNQRKLTPHQAASWVIARRGQGFKNKLAA